MALLAPELFGVHAAPPYAAASRPQDKRSVAAPDAGLQRLAGLNGFGGPPSYFGYGDQGAAYYPGVVPLPLVTTGFGGFGGVPAQHFDLATAGFTAFQYPAATFGYNAPVGGYPYTTPVQPAPRPQPETPERAQPSADTSPRLTTHVLPPAARANAVPATDVPSDHYLETPQQLQEQQPLQQQQQHQQPLQQQQQKQQAPEPATPSEMAVPGPESVADLVLELRPPPYSPPSENAYGPSFADGSSDVPAPSGPTPSAAAVPGDAFRGVDYESVRSVSYSLPPSSDQPSAAPAPSAQPADRPRHSNMVIVVSNSLFGGESDGPGSAVDSDPSRGTPPPPPQHAYANSNPLSANSYGDSNSVQPDPFRGAGDGYYDDGDGGSKIVIPASNSISANSKREQPAAAVRHHSASASDNAPSPYTYPSNVTPRD